MYRLIETAARETGRIAPWLGETDIFITPGFDFRVADGLMTNFHLPKSTLMMLVSAFLGIEEIRAVYDHAVAQGYRFFSYGDASLLVPDTDREDACVKCDLTDVAHAADGDASNRPDEG